MTLLKPLAAAAALCTLVLPAATLAQNQAIGPAWQLTYSYNLDPSLSPDGKRMVFISIIEGKEQLFTMNADGSGQKQITRGDVDLEDPAWSPDGRTIAFIRIEAKDKRIWLMDPDGSNQRPLTPVAQHAIHPNWTPDSKAILYCTDDDLDPPRKNAAEIYSIDVATKQVRTLISGGVNTYPVMSPDGTKIAFRRMLGEMNSEVFVANADGSGAKNLTNHPSFEGWPAWSPDGRTIAFGANRNSNYQIFLMDADGSNVRLLANTEGRATAPKWSADGKTVLFTNCRKIDFKSGCEILAAKVEPFAR